MLEALIVGLIASILGLLLGIATAQGINALFKAFGADLPQEGLVLKPARSSWRCWSGQS